MAGDVWDSFAEAVEVFQPKRPMKRASEKDLDACEKALGFRLPLSYRSFVKRFGAGEVVLQGGPAEWSIWAPGNPKNRFNSSLEHRNTRRQTMTPANWEGYVPDPTRACRLVYFADSPLSLNEYGWDPEDVADPDRHECGVYAVNVRYPPPDHLPRVADSFHDFIMGYCLDRYAKEQGYTKTAEWKKFGSMKEYHRH